MNGIRDDAERTAYGLRAGEGTSPEYFEHLLPKPIVEDNPVLHREAELPPAAPLVPVVHSGTEVSHAAPLVPVVHSETEVPPAAQMVPVVQTKTAVPTPLHAVHMQKEMLRSSLSE